MFPSSRLIRCALRSALAMALGWGFLSNPVVAGTFAREGSNVRYRHGNLSVGFQTDRGGAPLDVTYKGTRLVENFAGTGFQAVIYADNDLTQAGHNGIDLSPIAILNNSASAYHNYYARETVLNSSTYQIRGFFPYFLENYGPDVRYPSGSEGLWGEGDRSGGTPLWFLPKPGRPAAFAMVGRQNGDGMPPLANIPDGRVAFQVNVSLAGASSDAFAGVYYRRAVPLNAITNDNVYYSPGYSVLVNRLGAVNLWGPRGLMYNSGAKTAYKQTATSAAGIKLEVRTDNNSPSYQELWIDGTRVFTITPQMDPNPALGMNIGFFASAASGKVGFLNRRIFDVSKEVELTYTANNEESFNIELVARRAPGVPTPVRIYGTTQQAFLVPQNPAVPRNPDLLHTYSDATGWSNFAMPGLYPGGGINKLYVGSTALNFGLQCVPIYTFIDGNRFYASHCLLQVVNGAAAGIQQATLHISANAPEDYSRGRDSVEVRIKSKWRPYWSANP